MAQRRSRSPVGLLLALSVGLCATGCGGDAERPPTAPEEPRVEPGTAPQIVDDPRPRTARWAQAEELAADLAAVRHPSDGAGRAWLAGDAHPRRTAGEWTSFTVVYEAGPLGVAVGGSVHFLPEPFWGWSVPQDQGEERAGFTRVTTDAAGVTLATRTIGSAQGGYLVATVGGRALAEGEQVRFEYGAGRSAAQVDRHAERGARLWLYVDGDGDGVRGLVEDSPAIDVVAGPPAMIVVNGPSVARVGEEVRLRIAVLDQLANAGVDVAGELHVRNRPDGWDLPATLPLPSEAGGLAELRFRARANGVLRIAVELEVDGVTLRGEANPTWVHPDAPRVRWGDLHGHSNYSDGTGMPEDWYSYARDVAGLDVATLTDHDHFGVRFLDQHPAMWSELSATAERFYAPGEFVTALAYEWTSWVHGHRHVLYFDGAGEVLSSLDERYDTPRKLWDALRGRDALTFAHHSAGQPVPTNWSFAPDPTLEPLTEVVSVHGSSEAEDSPSPVRGAVRGNFVRDALDRGYRLGFVGSNDGHDGHPGLAHVSPVYGWLPPRPGEDLARVGTGGLAAIQTEDLTRAGVLAALRARHTYATSGPRIVLWVTLDGHLAGSQLGASTLGDPATLSLWLLGTAPLGELDIVRPSGVERYDLGGQRVFQGTLEVPQPRPGEYLYVRLLQTDGALAWSSPFFFDE